MLNLGGDVGALIVHTPPEWHGVEIEISPTDEPAPRTHSAVRERQVADGVFYSAVYPDLTAGRYTVWADDGSAVGMVTVVGGGVAEFVWPQHRVPAPGGAPA